MPFHVPATSNDASSRRIAPLLGAAVAAGFEAGAIGYVLPAMRQATGASAEAASMLLSVFVGATLIGVPVAALAPAATARRGCCVAACCWR